MAKKLKWYGLTVATQISNDVYVKAHSRDEAIQVFYDDDLEEKLGCTIDRGWHYDDGSVDDVLVVDCAALTEDGQKEQEENFAKRPDDDFTKQTA